MAAVASVKRAAQGLSLDAAMATETAATQDLLARIFGTIPRRRFALLVRS